MAHSQPALKRIVKMTFREDTVDVFISEVFENSKERIRAFPGCQHMELLRQTNQPNVLFTFSYWENEEALNTYRASALFAETWKKTKALFAEKAEAWSTEVVG
jgi:heme-degrading monooxygenase HmoA